MSSTNSFVGSVPDLYERYLTPFLAPYARDLARRIAAAPPRQILELACGTGLLTRELVTVMNGASLVATDLNEPMLDVARRLVRSDKVTFRPADAMALPFDDASFDLVVCQFGIMFFPDKVWAAREVKRVLRPGGTFLFNTWAPLEANALARITHETVTELLQPDPPTFATVPFGYGDPALVDAHMRQAGFGHVMVEPLDSAGVAESARDAALGFVEGNPMANAIREHGALPVAAVTDAVARRLEQAYGPGSVRLPTRAFVVIAR